MGWVVEEGWDFGGSGCRGFEMESIFCFNQPVLIGFEEVVFDFKDDKMAVSWEVSFEQ